MLLGRRNDDPMFRRSSRHKTITGSCAGLERESKARFWSRIFVSELWWDKVLMTTYIEYVGYILWIASLVPFWKAYGEEFSVAPKSGDRFGMTPVWRQKMVSKILKNMARSGTFWRLLPISNGTSVRKWGGCQRCTGRFSMENSESCVAWKLPRITYAFPINRRNTWDSKKRMARAKPIFRPVVTYSSRWSYGSCVNRLLHGMLQ